MNSAISNCFDIGATLDVIICSVVAGAQPLHDRSDDLLAEHDLAADQAVAQAPAANSMN
jgi:hypothetical protein